MLADASAYEVEVYLTAGVVKKTDPKSDVTSGT
jgi:hypothetical protein